MNNNSPINHHALNQLKKDEILSKIISKTAPVMMNKIFYKEGFNYLSDLIISQQLSIYAAKSIISKYKNYFGDDNNPKKILETTDIELRSLGISSQKAGYLKNLSFSVINNELNFKELEALSNQEVIDNLTMVKGIGTWTAKMYLIFVLGREDILPFEDGAISEQIKKLYKSKYDFKQTIKILNIKWSPYQSIAVKYLWKAKDEGIEVF